MGIYLYTTIKLVTDFNFICYKRSGFLGLMGHLEGIHQIPLINDGHWPYQKDYYSFWS